MRSSKDKCPDHLYVSNEAYMGSSADEIVYISK